MYPTGPQPAAEHVESPWNLAPHVLVLFSLCYEGWMVERLSDYPWIVVRVGCDLCNRSGEYKLARLAAKFGSEIPLGELLDQVAFDCPWRRRPGARPPGKYNVKCGAYFPDFDRPPPVPPDVPPSM